MLRAALAAFLLSAAPLLAQESPIAVEDAYAITPRPGATTGAAYMVIENRGPAPDRLVGVASPAAARVMLHTSAESDGVMRMTESEEGFEVPAGGELRLERGGEHIMFMGLTEPWADGQTVPVTLTFEGAGAVTVEVPVDQARLMGDAAPAATGDMDHMGEGMGEGMDMGEGAMDMDHGGHDGGAMDMDHTGHGEGQGG